ncbi:MAG: helix-turn-helix transcriptional regulator, partial [Lachnospiraceae bacterium]|nr:helix-turn-helix transcriptional regulator [Lachnospiraceae bacterium]
MFALDNARNILLDLAKEYLQHEKLASAVREARTELGLSQEKLAELLNIDSHTILNIQAGRGNPNFEKLYPLLAYLKIPAGKIFDSNLRTPISNGGLILAPLGHSTGSALRAGFANTISAGCRL